MTNPWTAKLGWFSLVLLWALCAWPFSLILSGGWAAGLGFLLMLIVCGAIEAGWRRQRVLGRRVL